MLKVDIVIPSFNRSKILNITLPTYLQDNVNRVLVIDDCSIDNTADTVKKMSSISPQIEYHKLPIKKYQMGAKNYGIALSTAEYIYFGDDDSILVNNSILNMLKIAQENEGSIVGARHIYLKEGEIYSRNLNDYERFPDNFSNIFNCNTMKLDLSYITGNSRALPYCQSCFMVSRYLAKTVTFDEKYFGTCYREETDYIVRLRKNGAGLIICDKALQINLPKSMCAGGTSSTSLFTRHFSEIINEYRFFHKNNEFLKPYLEISTNPFIRSFKLLISKFIKVIYYATR